MGNKRASLFLNTLSNLLVLAVNIGIGIFLTPFMISSLGKGSYGIWTLIWSVVGYYGILNLGLTTAIVRYIAKYSEKDELESLNKVVNSAFAVFSLTGGVAVLVSFLAPGLLASFFNISGGRRDEFVLVVKILGSVAGLGFAGNVMGSILRAQEKFFWYNVTIIISELSRGVMFLILLEKGYGLVGISYATLGATALRVLMHWFFSRLYVPQVRYSFRYVDKKVIGTLMKFGVFVWIAYICFLLRTQIDSVVIGKFLGFEMVGIYAVSALLIKYINRLGSSLALSLPPRFARMIAQRDHAGFRTSFINVSNIIGVTAFGVGIVGFICGRDFITLWVGDGFEAAATAFLILIVGITPDFAAAAAAPAVQALNRHRVYSYFALAEGVVNLALSVLLVQKFGLYGVALGTTIPIIINSVIVQPLYYTKVIGVSYWSYIFSCMGKPFIIALAAAAFFLIPGVMPAPSGYVQLLLKGLLAAALFGHRSVSAGVDTRQQADDIITCRTAPAGKTDGKGWEACSAE